jgi:hypothetical protein
MVSTAMPDSGHRATPEPSPLSIGALAAEAAAVMWDAECWGLPQPHYVTVSSTRSIDFQFADDPASFDALALWLGAFGGTIATDPIRCANGDPATLCRVNFTYHGVSAEAYALVKTETVI